MTEAAQAHQPTRDTTMVATFSRLDACVAPRRLSTEDSAKAFAEIEVSALARRHPGLPVGILDDVRREALNRFLAVKCTNPPLSDHYLAGPYTVRATVPEDTPIAAWHTLDDDMRLTHGDDRKVAIGEVIEVDYVPYLRAKGLHGSLRLTETLLAYGWRDRLCRVSLFGDVEFSTCGLVAATHRRIDEAYSIPVILREYLFYSAMGRLDAIGDRFGDARKKFKDFIDSGYPEDRIEQLMRMMRSLESATGRQVSSLEAILLPEVSEVTARWCQDKGDWQVANTRDIDLLKEHMSAMFAFRTACAALSSLPWSYNYSSVQTYRDTKKMPALRSRKLLESTTLPSVYRIRYGCSEDFPEDWLREESEAIKALIGKGVGQLST